MGERREVIPSPWPDAFEELAMGRVMATAESGRVGGGASRRPALTLDRIGVSVGFGTHGEPRTACVRPPPLYIARRQGPTNQCRVGRPRSKRGQGVR
jgi:hypothetical protein